jgi:hypothetical protein
MKILAASAAFLLAASLSLSAIPADITYSEGDASVRLKSGKQQDAEIGIAVNTGDTLKTGADGLVELNQKGVNIKIAHNTVFALMERAQGNQTTSVLSVTLGSIKFRYDKLTGSEPQVRTNGAVAGVRGTEFTVFSGADGSTLFAVDSGQVTVEAEGKSVDLGASEGVEVPLGKPPGDKFTVHRDQVNYSTWNDDKLQAMLADPEAAMTSIETAMAGYITDVNDYAALFIEYKQKLDAERANRQKITDEKGKEEGTKYETDVVFPLMVQTSSLSLNLAYSSLAALSLRRFVAGRLYILLKSRLIAHPDDQMWIGFTSRFGNLLEQFEEAITPHLVEANI